MEEQPPLDDRPRRPLVSEWTVLAMAVASLALVNLVGLGASDSGTADVDYQAISEGDLLIQQALSAPASKSTAFAQRAIAAYEQVMPAPAAARRILVTSRHFLNTPATQALSSFTASAAIGELPKRESAALAAEERIWREVFGAKMLSSARARELVQEVDKLDLGPLRPVAVSRIYAMSGQHAEARRMLARAAENARRSVYGLTLLTYALVAAGLIGLALLAWYFAHRGPDLLRAVTLPAPATALVSAFLVYLLSYLLFGSIAGAAADGSELGEGQWALVLHIAAATAAGYAGLAWLRLLVGNWREALHEAGGRVVPLASAVFWGLGGYAAMLPVIGVTALVWQYLARVLLPWNPTPEHPLVPEVASGGLTLVLAALLAVVVAPVAEELAFRGMLYGAFRGRMKALPAAALVGVVFALVHPTLPGQFLPIMALGMSLALLRESTGSLAPCVVCHALNNAMALVQVMLRG